jgi:uncharacterized protein RhaS with RHS repeats
MYATHKGLIRRISLEPTPISASLVSQITAPLEGVLSLSYSDRLKLVAYTTGSGEAAVVACAARLNMSFLHGPKSTTLSHFAPRALLVRVETGAGGRSSVKTGTELEMEALYEASRGTTSLCGLCRLTWFRTVF